MQFFLPMIPPTITAQQHKVSVCGNKPRFYDPPELVSAKAKLYAHLAPHKPQRPMDGPIRLLTKWIWPGEAIEWKTTKPDTDNLVKALKDTMEGLGFFKNDSRVCSEITEKFFGPTPGIFIQLEALTPIKEIANENR